MSDQGHHVDPVKAFGALTPNQMLDAIESREEYRSDGCFLALNSYENRVYRIGIEDSGPVVAKFYRPERWSDEAILEEHRFTEELAQAEIPAIAPIPDSQGNTLHHHDGFRFAIYPCQGGRAPELDDAEHLEQLGRLVGRMHAVAALKTYQHRPSINIDDYALRPKIWLLANGFIPEHLQIAYATLTDDLVEQVQASFDRAGKVAFIRLHGDLHPGNILWFDDSPFVVDFDDVRMGPAIQDLWMFLSGDRPYMTKCLADLLDGYTRFYDFDPRELHLVEALRTLRMIQQAHWMAWRWQDPAFPIAFPWFNTQAYWESHILALREQAALLNEPPLVWS